MHKTARRYGLIDHWKQNINGFNFLQMIFVSNPTLRRKAPFAGLCKM